MRLALRIFITFCILAIQPSVADQGSKAAKEQSEAENLQQKHAALSSSQLGELIVKIQERVYSISQGPGSIWDGSKDTDPLQREQDAIIRLLQIRSKEGDREAGFQVARWSAFQCTGFLKLNLRFADQICEYAGEKLKELADQRDLRAMVILGNWYESGTYFERSNYAAAEWYAKIMNEATQYGYKSLAMTYLEKVDRLYPRYPDLETYRRKIHALK